MPPGRLRVPSLAHLMRRMRTSRRCCERSGPEQNRRPNQNQPQSSETSPPGDASGTRPPSAHPFYSTTMSKITPKPPKSMAQPRSLACPEIALREPTPRRTSEFGRKGKACQHPVSTKRQQGPRTPSAQAPQRPNHQRTSTQDPICRAVAAASRLNVRQRRPPPCENGF